MKISNYLIFNFVTIILVFLPSGLTQVSVRYSTFTYPEITNQPNLTGTQPQILTFTHYNDNSGTAVVRIARVNYYNTATNSYCYEQRLLLRVIQINGRVIELNYEDATEIQDINYCAVRSTNWQPNEFIVNNITPKKGFLRLSAVNDINGGSSFKWSQYGYNGNGVFFSLTNDTVPIVNSYSTSFQVTVFATLNDGYAIVYANTTNNPSAPDPLSTQLTAKAGIYAILLNYNQTSTSKRIILYEMTSSNLTFSSLFCSVDYVSIGHTCIISANQTVYTPTNINITYYPNLTTTTLVGATTTTSVPILNTPVNITIVDNTVPPNITSKLFDIKIRFLSTGSVISLTPIFNITSNNIISIISIRTLPLGGYAYITRQFNQQNINFDFSLYNELDQLYTDWTFPLLPILSNMNGAFDVLQNNTILVALNGSTTTWSCFVIDLPKLAPQIDLLLNTDTINITYYDRISLSDGNLTIYQTINITKIPRLMINSRTCDASKCIPLGTILNLKVLTSTFNDPGGKYSIEIDNNFVKNSDYNEPILGIDPNIWNFQTNNNVTLNQKRTGDVRGKLRLTASGTTYFLSLNDSGRNDFFTGLINELLVIIPTEQGRLDSSKLHQNDPSNTDLLLISLIVYEMKNGDKKNATAIQNDLDQLIRNKYVTGISLFGNQTLLLDEKYGFQPS
ncbi:14270_t:CDS:2, partial [Gigaspora margarita]